MSDDRSKALKLKWSKNISLKRAWELVKKKEKKKKGEPTRKRTTSTRNTVPKSTRPKSTKSTTSKPSVKKIINGKERKVYTGSSGGKYYKSKGKRVYLGK